MSGMARAYSSLANYLLYLSQVCLYYTTFEPSCPHYESKFLVYLKTRNVAHFWYTTPAKIITPAWQLEIRLEYKGSFDLR